MLVKLGIGGKDEHDPEKQQKIDAGFMYLKQQEQQQDSDGNNKLTLEQANQAAQRTKAQHPVFSSIHAVADGEDIAYEYTASPKNKKGSPGGKQNQTSTRQVKSLNTWKRARLKLISNGEKMLTHDQQLAYEQAQEMANQQILKSDARKGDGTSAYIAMLEQYNAGPGNIPVPIVGSTLHYSKALETITAINNKLNLEHLPGEAKDVLNAQKEKIKEALDWINRFNNGENPKVPSWAREYGDFN